MKRILIDAIYSGETRVAVLNESNILENFDHESTSKKQLKGNIYLAKVTRVEASLQAAFLEYGGGKQGFLPFSEIHPDYYNFPQEKQTEELGDSKIKDIAESIRSIQGLENIDNIIEEASRQNEELNKNKEQDNNDKLLGDNDTSQVSDEKNSEVDIENEEEIEDNKDVQELYRKYKIQDVIRKNQIMLVQVIKEERGNKGVTISTYVSLAGRFCVLMPNSPKKGGISRRISESRARKRIKNIVDKLNLPQNCAVIVRTAGADRSEAEIIRDYDYLVRLWNNIRKHTLNSSAPSFIHEESSLIKRFIRDSYDSEVKEILVHGELAYHEARNFMKMIMPTDYHCVKFYRSKIPIFTRFKVEEQIASLYQPIVPLKTGAYLVINITEALISIDVNSGRATSEKNVEETASKTNIEAAIEIAKQIRMRDLSGLIVIDFIDMDDVKNRINIERILRTELTYDKARVQMGRISEFGLLEMSRQRLKASYHETHSTKCPNCTGSGYVRSPESMAIAVLRAIQHEISFDNIVKLVVNINSDSAIYILNNKRSEIKEIEHKNNVKIIINNDDSNITNNNFFIEKVKPNDILNEEDRTALTSLDNIEMTDLDIATLGDGYDEKDNVSLNKNEENYDRDEFNNETNYERPRKARYKRYNNHNNRKHTNNRQRINRTKNEVNIPSTQEKSKGFFGGLIRKFIK